MKKLKQYLNNEIKYHFLLENSGNYWGKIIVNNIYSKLDGLYYNGIIKKDLDSDRINKELKQILGLKKIKIEKYNEKKSGISFKPFYLVVFNYLMGLLVPVVVCSSIIIPLFLIPLNIFQSHKFGNKEKSEIKNEFVITEKFIQDEFVRQVMQPLLPSPPSGLRISTQ